MNNIAKYSPISLSLSSSCRSSAAPDEEKEALEKLKKELEDRQESDASVSSISSRGSQIDLSNLTDAFKAT